MPNIKDSVITQIREAAVSIFHSYLALDYLNDAMLDVEGQSFKDYIANRIKRETQPVSKSILITGIKLKGISHTVLINPPQDGHYSIKISRPASLSESTLDSVKKPTDYSPLEMSKLLQLQQISFHINGEKHAFAVKQEVDGSVIKLGGADKIQLYRSHLLSLTKIIERLQSGTNIHSMLIGLAAGSGKTFIQAIWFLILRKASVNGIFALPGKLISQFKKDFALLLPNSVVEKIQDLNAGTQENLLAGLANNNGAPLSIVTASETLLDEHYEDLLRLSGDDTLLSFDEQHLIMRREDRKLKLVGLAEKFLSMFLTATPSQETYEKLCNRSPVVLMSSKQKQESGQGKFPAIQYVRAKDINDKNKILKARKKQVQLGYLEKKLANAIQKPSSSPTEAMLEALTQPILVNDETNIPISEQEIRLGLAETKKKRWKQQYPHARKALILVNDHESAIDIHNMVTNGLNHSHYQNGNLANRQSIFDFFSIQDADGLVNTQYYQDADHIDAKEMSRQLDENIYHGFVELFLRDLTGMTTIELNQLRFKDLAALTERIKSQYSQSFLRMHESQLVVYYTQRYDIEKNKRGVNRKQSDEIATILAQINLSFRQTYTATHNDRFFSNSISSDWRACYAFVDNDFCNKSLKNLLPYDYHNNLRERLDKNLSKFSEKFKTVFLFDGMSQLETKIDEVRPFSGFTHIQYDLHKDGTLVENAKKRKRNALEILDDTTKESSYEPHYLGLTEEETDNMFKLGLIPMYVSNRKTEGFSDPDLHTVATVVPKTTASTNNPTAVIQGIGRNRGLDDTQKPIYVVGLAKDADVVLDARELEISDDYYPSYFKAKRKFNKLDLIKLGKWIAEKIFLSLPDPTCYHDDVPSDVIQKEVMGFVLSALREINDNNGHNIALSRAELAKVVSVTRKELRKNILELKSPYKLSFGLVSLSRFLYGLSTIYDFFRGFLVRLFLRIHSTFNSSKYSKPEATYLKIIRNTSLTKLIAAFGPARSLEKVLQDRVKRVEAIVQDNVGAYLNLSTSAKLNRIIKTGIMPVLMKWFKPEDQARIETAISNDSELIALLIKHRDAFKGADITSRDGFNHFVLPFLQKINGLNDLMEEAVLDFPQIVTVALDSIKTDIADCVKQNAPNREYFKQQLIEFIHSRIEPNLITFFSVEDVAKLVLVFSNDEKVAAMADALVQKIVAQIETRDADAASQLDQGAILAEFIEICSSQLEQDENAQTLQTRDLTIEHHLNVLQSFDLLTFINTATKTELNDVVAKDLVPILVKCYAPKNQAELENKARSYQNWAEILLKNKAVLEEHASNSDKLVVLQNTARTLFNAAFPGDPLLVEHNYAKQVDDSIAAVSYVFNRLMPEDVEAEGPISQKPILAKMTRRFTNVAKTVTNVPTAYNQLGNYLKEGFLTDTKAFFTADDHEVLVKALSNVNNRRLFSVRLAMLSDAEKQRLISEKLDGLLKILGEIDPSVKDLKPVHVRATDAFTKLEAVSQKILENTSECFDHNKMDAFDSLVRSHLLPILCASLEPTVRYDVYANLLPYKNWQGLVLPELQSLLSNDEATKENAILSILNSALSPTRLLKTQLLSSSAVTQEVNDVTTQISVATQQLFQRNVPYQQGIVDSLIEYFVKAETLTKLSTFFSPSMFEKVTHILKNQDLRVCFCKLLVENAFQNGFDLSKENLLMVLNQIYHKHCALDNAEPILFLDDEITRLGDEMDETFSGVENLAIFDVSRLNKLIFNNIIPIIKLPEFKIFINTYVGYLNDSNLADLVHAVRPQPENSADLQDQLQDLKDLIKCVKKGDFDTLAEKLLTLNEYLPDLNQIKFEKTLKLLVDVCEEVMNCCCYFNDTTNKGLQGSILANILVKPKLLPPSTSLDLDRNFGNNSSIIPKKLFFIHGLARSFPHISNVQAFAERDSIRLLNRIDKNILQPLSWTVNRNAVAYYGIQFCKNAWFGIRSGAYGVLNGLRSVRKKFASEHVILTDLQLHSPSKAGQEYNDLAFELGHKISVLSDLKQENLTQNGQTDSVDPLFAPPYTIRRPNMGG